MRYILKAAGEGIAGPLILVLAVGLGTSALQSPPKPAPPASLSVSREGELEWSNLRLQAQLSRSEAQRLLQAADQYDRAATDKLNEIRAAAAKVAGVDPERYEARMVEGRLGFTLKQPEKKP